MTTESHAIREADAGDWLAIAALLGRPSSAARELSRHLLTEYDPGIALVATAPGAAEARTVDGSTAPQVAGAVIAGIPRTQALGTPSDERHARLVWISVAPPQRRCGLGTRLLGAALDELRTRGATRVTLTVDGKEIEALALFRATGFELESQDLGLVLPPEGVARLAAKSAPLAGAEIRPLGLDDVPLLIGLLIQLGLERAEAPHDTLEALTPAQVEHWLQNPGTVAFAAWEQDDPRTPLGIAWASRRRDDTVLRFVAVHDDHRRRGIGIALLVSLAQHVALPNVNSAQGGTGSAAPALQRPLRAPLNEPGDEQEFFRALGFEVERITYRMARALRGKSAGPQP